MHPQTYAWGPGVEEKRSYVHKGIHFNVSSSPKCRSQAAVSFCAPRMCLKSGYFLVNQIELDVLTVCASIDQG